MNHRHRMYNSSVAPRREYLALATGLKPTAWSLDNLMQACALGLAPLSETLSETLSIRELAWVWPSEVVQQGKDAAKKLSSRNGFDAGGKGLLLVEFQAGCRLHGRGRSDLKEPAMIQLRIFSTMLSAALQEWSMMACRLPQEAESASAEAANASACW